MLRRIVSASFCCMVSIISARSQAGRPCCGGLLRLSQPASSRLSDAGGAQCGPGTVRFTAPAASHVV